MTTTAGRQHAARAVAARRGELGMTQQELAAKARVDVKTVGSLETRGRWPIARNRAGIEKALGWQPGEMDRVAAVDGTPERDVLAERWGRDDADRVRAMMRRHLSPAAASQLISEMEREFTEPAEAPSAK